MEQQGKALLLYNKVEDDGKVFKTPTVEMLQSGCIDRTDRPNRAQLLLSGG
jgi:hypothetical protein